MPDKKPEEDKCTSQKIEEATTAAKAEAILEILVPEIRHAKCTHKKVILGKEVWNYWEAYSGLCWCNGCGKCLNGQWEYEAGFRTHTLRELHGLK